VDYVQSVIDENWSMLIQVLHFVTTSVPEFLDGATKALSTGNRRIAIVLLATAAEHVLNEYIRLILMSTTPLTQQQITQVQKTSMEVKLDWLFPLIAKRELSVEIKKRVRKLADTRNAIVHDKVIATSLADWEDEPDAVSIQLKQLDLKALMELPNELDNELNLMLASVTPSQLKVFRYRDL
jgi:hypothetical protein